VSGAGASAGPGDGVADRVRARHVRRNGEDGVVATREIRGGLVQSFGITGDDADPDPLLVQRLGHRIPDAATRAGDQGNSTLQT
jgi:hypothetical protein